MAEAIKLVFHNQGLRSYIEVDLCMQCPRQDDKGCCGYYSPVFYLSDFAYWLRMKPTLVDFLFSLPNLTILDASVTINSAVEGSSYRCQFHTRDKGCLLSQDLRESICRHFVCPGINWEREDALITWKLFFEQLSVYEVELNQRLANIFDSRGLSLRNVQQRMEIFSQLPQEYKQLTRITPAFFKSSPGSESAIVYRNLTFGKDWLL